MNGLIAILSVIKAIAAAARFVGRAAALPHTLHEFITNHFAHLRDDVEEIKADVHRIQADVREVRDEQTHQRRLCERTRAQLAGHPTRAGPCGCGDVPRDR